jgi:hypothetical protein
MKSTKVFSLAVLLLLAAGSVYAGSGFDSVADKAKKANEAVRSVNDVIRDVDQTVEGVGGAKEGVKEIGRDTTDVLGIDTTKQPQQTQQQAQPTPAQANSPIVLPNGEAWVKDASGLRSGFIFQADGKYLSINDYDGEVFGQWTVARSGTWTVNGNNLTATSDSSGASMTYAYAVSGNNLTLDFLGSKETYTKTSGVIPTTDVYGR